MGNSAHLTDVVGRAKLPPMTSADTIAGLKAIIKDPRFGMQAAPNRWSRFLARRAMIGLLREHLDPFTVRSLDRAAKRSQKEDGLDSLNAVRSVVSEMCVQARIFSN